MFYTFKPDKHSISKRAEPEGRTLTLQACEPCRRRKIRCNGENPCEACHWYKRTASCRYDEQHRRAAPLKRLSAKTNQTLQRYQDIFQLLFNDTDPERLHGLSRDGLIELIGRNGPRSPAESQETPRQAGPESNIIERLLLVPKDGTSDNIESYTFEVCLRPVDGRVDDVSLFRPTLEHPAMYMGISSPVAALRAITWLCSDFRIVPNKVRNQKKNFPTSMGAHETPGSGLDDEFSAWNEIPLINAYFSYFHPSYPLIDENSFRRTYLSRNRADSRWRLLLNVVLALGSIGASTADDTTHMMYYERAKQYIGPETFFSAHLETVQALALLGGSYLHHIQRPDEGIAMMGVVLRLASALGLHQAMITWPECYESEFASKASAEIEMRSRIWWSLFNMDTWGYNSIGRPSMCRMSHATTIPLPQEPIGISAPTLTLLQDSVRYCMISTRIDDAMAISPLIGNAERDEYDKTLLEWYRSSSIQELAPNGQAERISVQRNTLRWRYRLLRISLYRSILLSHAMRKTTFATLEPRQKAAIETCRELTNELITDISTTWRGEKPCQVSGCGATWFLYQATMVPLLSLFCSFDLDVIKICQQQVEAAMSLLSELHSWAPMAESALEEVGLIYQVSRRRQSQTDSATTQPAIPIRFDLNEDASFESIDSGGFFDLWSPNALGNSPSLTQAADWENGDRLFALQDVVWDFDASR